MTCMMQCTSSLFCALDFKLHEFAWIVRVLQANKLFYWNLLVAKRRLFSMSMNDKKTVIVAQGFAEDPVILMNGAPLEVVSKC